MRNGYINVSKQIIEDHYWPEIEKELFKHFTVHSKEDKGDTVKFNGTSELFDETVENESIEYECWFKTNEERKPEFIKFRKC